MEQNFSLQKVFSTGALVVAIACSTLSGCASNSLTPPTSTPVIIQERGSERTIDPAKLAAIGPVFDKYAREGRIAGGGILVAQHGKVLYRHYFGMTDIAAGTKTDKQTVYRIFSMTKPVVAAAVLRLQEMGKLKLTDPVAKYVPEFAHLQVYLSGTRQNMTTESAATMTVEQLLTHTSGLDYSFQRASPVASLYKQAGLDAGTWFHDPTIDGLDDMAKRLAGLPLIEQPGGSWHYGMSFDVAGLLVSRVSGQPLDTFLRDNFFRPLGMNHTGFMVKAADSHRLATLYSPREDGGLSVLDPGNASAFLKPPSADSGGGGLVSTLDDYFRFAQMLANGGSLDGVRVLARTSVDTMMANHLRPSQLGQLPILAGAGFSATGKGLGFGFGGALVIDPAAADSPGAKGEYAWNGAAGTTFLVDRKNGIVMVYMMQLVPAKSIPFRQTLRKLIYSADEK